MPAGRFTAAISRSTRNAPSKSASTNQPFRSRKRQRTQPGPSIRIARGESDDDGFEDVNEDDSGDEEDGEDGEEEEEHEGVGGRYATRRKGPVVTSGSASSSTGGNVSKAPGARNPVRRRDSLPRRTSPPLQSTSTLSPNRRSNKQNDRLHPSTPHRTLRKQFSRRSLRKQPSTSHLRLPRTRATKILSPLPVNHSLRRSTSALVPKASVLSRKAGPPPLPSPPPRGATVPAYQTRTLRASGSGSGSGSGSNESPRGRKRKRNVVVFRQPVSEEDEDDSEEEVEDDEDEQDSDDLEQSGDEEEEESEDDEVGPLARRLRSADLKHSDDEEEAEEQDEESEEDDAASEVEEEEDSEEEDSDAEMSTENDQFHLYSATSNQLRRLRRSDLARLYSIATEEHISTTASLTKDPLILGIVEARPEETDETEVEAEDEEDGNESPRPFTSHEGSPEVSKRKSDRKVGRPSKKRGDRRTHVPTPPPSSTASSEASATEEEEEEDESEGETVDQRATNHRAVRTRTQSLPQLPDHRKRTAVTRRGSQDVAVHLEAPKVRRTRSNSHATEADVGRTLRNGKSVAVSPQLNKGKAAHVQFGAAEAGDLDEYGSPIAHRTRHGHHSPSTSVSPRSKRGGKKAIVAPSMARRSSKGKEKAIDQDAMSEDEEEELHGDDDQIDEGDEMMEDAPPTPPRRLRRGAASATASEPSLTTTTRNLRKSSKTQVETPPSDADEESGADSEVEEGTDDEEEEGDMSIEMISHQRPARQLRNGKVVLLEEGTEEEEESEDVEEEDEEEVVAEEEASDAASDAMDEDDEDADDLTRATSKSLLRRRRDDLVRLCEERHLEGEGTKKELIHALLEWRDQDFDASSGSSSAASTASAASNVTARAETKTQALHAALDDEAIHQSKNTPLLMRRGHSCSPEKPQSATRDKTDEQEEVNALDLESLQLQDKEIPPEKLTKLEKVGSGGFKDVYKGIYRKKTIAIADIRGHLTEMDIKELGLLRDLRHDNIVHFIGVSIPKAPSSVPVMIVTELCANGDLFDYIRAVPTPPFLTLLQIMVDIARGIEYLHTRKPLIIHRDIKSSNVLITAQGRAKINDFGLARVRTSTRSIIRSLVGTVNWQAPELWSPHPRYNEKVDVYSVALVYWEMLQWHQPVKRYPFEGLNEHAIYDSVGHKNLRPPTASMGRQWGQEILQLMGAMWDSDASARPSMAQVAIELDVLLTTEKEKVKEEKKLLRR